ncbi:MAG: response regulator transcription factor [Actinobacteria bacterium]|nr:response regulator transcription factor [Actinomycetota bacterium]
MIRVLLVDDQALVRSGFRVILETQPDFEVVGEAANGEEAVQLAATLTPDVICMDVEMPVMNGLEASRLILAPPAASTNETQALPSILVLTTFGHQQYLFDALAAGVSGFLLKTSRAEQLIDAIRTLANGGALLGPDVTRAVMLRAAELSNDAASAPGADATVHTEPRRVLSNSGALDAAGLTEREREVLSLIALGHSNGEIAGELFLGEATVKTHVSNLLQKIGARDRVQLVVWAHTVGST